ncbi:hypothetical protein Tco_0706646 [Tanacetum coccineum]|uniref:Uncharacterized protein n=1 Tax=Tanacetum coccineum TaxID=301880 RepID=A0ABQ4Y8V4_9ASTR
MSKKELLRLDEELAFKLQAEEEEEEEERLTIEKAQQVEEANIGWDDVQANIDVDYQLAQRLQAQEQDELTDEEKARLTELVEESSKKATAEIAHESSLKREGEELKQESSKNQKLEEDKESEELKQCLEIIPDDGDDVTIDATPLSTKSPTIVDYKIYKEGKKSYFQIIRADGNSQMYLTFGKMLKNFDREDLEVLWSIVKARFKKTEPVNYMDNFLLLNLKTMFEHHVEDNVWKNQQGLVKVLNWKLYDSCGVHCVTMQNMLFYLLVEKIYPLTNHTLHQMFNDVKLQVDYECEMAFELLRLVKKQLKEGYGRIVGIKSLLEVTAAKEDLAYQIDNMDSKKQDKMSYPRFMKIIIHHFLENDKSISMRNRTFMHIARDDSLLSTMRFVSRHVDTQVYGAIIPKAITNQALLDSVAYKTYYAIASGAEPPKSRKSQKKSYSSISSEESPSKKKSAKAKKVVAAKPKPTKKKAPVKADKGKGLNVLSKIALSEAAQLKEATKQRKKDVHISHASGSGDGTNFELGVPDEQHLKTSGEDEGTSSKPGVPDVPKYDYESDKESWGDIGEEDDDDEDGTEDDEENDDSDANDDEEETDSDRTKPDKIKIHSGFEQVGEDAHVTLTPVLDTQKTDEPVQSSSVSSNFTSKLLNLENPFLADNEIASLMDTTVHRKELGSQTSSLYTILIMAVLAITSIFTTTIPPPPPFFNPLLQQATPTPTPTISEATASFPSLLDFSFVFKFNDRVTNLEKDLSEIKHVDQYAQAFSSIPAIVDRYIDNKLREAIQKAIVSHKWTSTYEAAASLSEFELTKILIDKMEKNMSYDKADYKRELYNALVKSYQTDKDLFDTYGKKRRKSSKEAESSRDLRSKEKKSLSTSKNASHSQHKPSGKSAHAEEPSHTVDDLGVQQDQEFDIGNNDEQPVDKEVSKDDWFKKPERPLTPDSDWNKRQHLMDTSFDFSAFVLKRVNIKDLTQEILVGPSFELLKGTYKSLTELEYHLEECSKPTTERLDWHNFEGKLYPFDLSKPLPLIPDHRGHQVIHPDFFINNDLEYLKGGDLSRRYSTSVTKTKAATYEIKWIEDLVRNLSNLKNRTVYTAYSDPKGVIYKGQNNKNRLMHADELHKFSDGTLNDVRSALHDTAKGIRMKYLSKMKWSGLDKRRARVMI